MARRRLTPTAPERDPANVARAEHLPGADVLTRLSLSPNPAPAPAPIARVASDAASAAALQEMSDAWSDARDRGRMVLDLDLGAIAAGHLLRDRLPEADAEMAELSASLRTHGQRTPVEVTPLKGPQPYGLISGWRRLAALKALHAETGEARFATIQALVRHPETAADAYVSMVEENEIRAGLSHYERARVAALATARGVFPDEKKALLTLFATASRAKRSRIRAFLDIYHALDGSLRFPAALPERLGLKLVERVRAGGGAAISEAIARDDPRTPEAERATLTALLAPPRSKAPPAPAPEIRPGVAYEERLRGDTLTLRLKGPGVTPALRTEIRALLEGRRG